MKHSYIEEHNVIDRYLMGRLSDEELIEFEEHFLDCKQCTNLLRATDRLRAALRTAAVENTEHAQKRRPQSS